MHTRRHFMLMAAAAVVGSAGAGADEAVAAGAAIRYMQRVAADLIAAQRDGRPAAYYRVITRHADLPAISLYSLGQYQSQLPKSKRYAFYRGVAGFMSRYFADQAKDYRVVKAEFSPTTRQDGDFTLVDSKLTLASGSTYNVAWRLARRRSGYRIADIRVLGFSLVYLQQRIFQSYISKKGGDVGALVAALTR